jgi:hypothetical protein
MNWPAPPPAAGRSMSLRSGGKSCGDVLRRCGENSGDAACDIDSYIYPDTAGSLIDRSAAPGTELNLSALLFWFTDRPTTPITSPPSGLSDCCARLCTLILCAASGKSPLRPSHSASLMLTLLRTRICARSASHRYASSQHGALASPGGHKLAHHPGVLSGMV